MQVQHGCFTHISVPLRRLQGRNPASGWCPGTQGSDMAEQSNCPAPEALVSTSVKWADGTFHSASSI